MRTPEPTHDESHNDAELDRVRASYERYDTEASEQIRRDAANPGLARLISEWHGRLVERLENESGLDLSTARILDVGCGTGGLLDSLIRAGADPSKCFGVDLMPNRVAIASGRLPGARISVGDAGALDFGSDEFDLVCMSMVVSSIPSDELAGTVCGEALRVVKPGGTVAWYDIRTPNPMNPDVRALRRGDVHRLFPDTQVVLESITLLPPVARKLGRGTDRWYPRLSRIPVLRGRYLGLITNSEK